MYGFCLIDVLQPSTHYYDHVEHGQLTYTHYFRASLYRLSSLPVQVVYVRVCTCARPCLRACDPVHEDGMIDARSDGKTDGRMDGWIDRWIAK